VCACKNYNVCRIFTVRLKTALALAVMKALALYYGTAGSMISRIYVLFQPFFLT
jgi:hypothetical protein